MSNFKKLVAAGVAATAILGVAGVKPAAATPATLGFYPSTDIYGDKVIHFDVDRYNTNDFSGVGAADTSGLTYGIGDTNKVFGRTEVGYDYFSNSGVNFGKSLFFNGKTQLYDNAKGVRVVGGLWLAGDTNNPLVSNTGYLLASKTFGFGRIHVGVAHAFSSKNIKGPNGDGDSTFLHLAYDRALTPKFTFVADYYSGRSTISGVQPTLYYNFNDKADFGIGYFFGNAPRNFGNNNNQLYLCFDYNFGGPKAATGEPSMGDPGSPGA